MKAFIPLIVLSSLGSGVFAVNKPWWYLQKLDEYEQRFWEHATPIQNAVTDGVRIITAYPWMKPDNPLYNESFMYLHKEIVFPNIFKEFVDDNQKLWSALDTLGNNGWLTTGLDTPLTLLDKWAEFVSTCAIDQPGYEHVKAKADKAYAPMMPLVRDVVAKIEKYDIPSSFRDALKAWHTELPFDVTKHIKRLLTSKKIMPSQTNDDWIAWVQDKVETGKKAEEPYQRNDADNKNTPEYMEWRIARTLFRIFIKLLVEGLRKEALENPERGKPYDIRRCERNLEAYKRNVLDTKYASEKSLRFPKKLLLDTFDPRRHPRGEKYIIHDLLRAGFGIGHLKTAKRIKEPMNRMRTEDIFKHRREQMDGYIHAKRMELEAANDNESEAEDGAEGDADEEEGDDEEEEEEEDDNAQGNDPNAEQTGEENAPAETHQPDPESSSKFLKFKFGGNSQ